MPAFKIGITLPVLREIDELGVPDVRTQARHVEQLGLPTVRVPDLLIGDGTPALEATATAATAAAVTERVEICFSVRVIPLQPAALLAAQIATLQQLSGDRIVLGVGSGGFPSAPFWRASGVAPQERGRRTDATLRVLRELIRGEEVALDPEASDVSWGADTDGATIRLAPAATPPPILVGGNSATARRRAVDYGDGWMPSILTPAALAGGAARLRELAEERGRATPSIVVSGAAVPGVDSAAKATLEAFTAQLVGTYGLSPEDAAQVPIAGTPAQLAERFAAYAEAGAEAVGIAVNRPDWMRAVELIAEARDLMT